MNNYYVHKFLLLLIILFIGVSGVKGQQILTLDSCRFFALEKNKEMTVARKRMEAATSLKKAAFTQYLPHFNARGAYLHTNKKFQLFNEDKYLPIIPFSAFNPETGKFDASRLSIPEIARDVFVINPLTQQPIVGPDGNPVFRNFALLPASQAKFGFENHYIFNASVIQPIFTGFKVRELYRISRYAENIARENVNLSHADIIYKTDEAYWRVLALQYKVALAHKYKGLLERLVSDLENVYAEGIITKTDLLKAKVKLNEAELILLKANNGLEISKMAMAQIIGKNYKDIGILDTTKLHQILPEYSVNPEKQVENRAEIGILKQNVNIATSGVSVMRSRFLPDISLIAGYTFMNPNPYKGMEKKFGGDWNIGIQASIPIFHWGERIHTMKAMKREAENASLKLEEARELINVQINQVFFKYKEAKSRIELTRHSKEQAEENMNMSRDNFEEGILMLTDLLEAQVLWEKAYTEYIDALIEARMCESELLKVTGGIYK